MFIVASLLLVFIYFILLIFFLINLLMLKKHLLMSADSAVWRFSAEIDIKYYLVLFCLLYLILNYVYCALNSSVWFNRLFWCIMVIFFLLILVFGFIMNEWKVPYYEINFFIFSINKGWIKNIDFIYIHLHKSLIFI